MKKQILLFILALLPMVAKADDSGTCGPNLTWTYVEATKTLTISGSGEMNNYNASYFNGNYITTAPWGTYYQIIQAVVIELGVTSIGNGAFYNCSGLTFLRLVCDSATSKKADLRSQSHIVRSNQADS